MPLIQLDQENADLNIYASAATCLTDTPSTTSAKRCIAQIDLGDGTKNLNGSGGNFIISITVGSQSLQPSGTNIVFGTGVRSQVQSQQFTVPASSAVVVKVKSPNSADTDVDVTCTLFEGAQGDTDDDLYQAKISYVEDTNDEWTATWFKNGVRITSGITSPTIQVIKRSDGTNLVSATAMTEIGSTESWKYDESTNKIAANESYLVVAAGTIDGSARSDAEIWYKKS